MMKILFLSLVFYGTFAGIFVLAKTDSGRDIIDGAPATWHVDVFEDLQKQFPTIQKKNVILVRIASNDSRWIKQMAKASKANVSSASKSVDVERKDRTVTFVPQGESLKPEDRIVLNYNQKALIYIPEIKQAVWVTPNRNKITLRAYSPIENELIDLQKLAENTRDLPAPKPKSLGQKMLNGLKNMGVSGSH